MKSFFTILASVLALSVVAQITPSDSSVQVIGYWSTNELQSYKIINSKYKTNDGDTVGRQKMWYNVDIKVLDSTANSYTIEWAYRDIAGEGLDKFTQSLMGLTNNTKVVIKTDEMGAFQEVINWKEMQQIMKQGIDKLGKEFKDIPNIKDILRQVEKTMTTREAIEAQAINEIHQFYTFHGAKYTLNEEYTRNMVSNGVPGHPVNVEMVVRLTDINVEEDNAIVRMWKTYDVKQMTDATYEMMKALTGLSVKNFPSRESMPDVNFEESVFSRVHGPSGWIIYSIHTKQTATGANVEIEEREIEIL